MRRSFNTTGPDPQLIWTALLKTDSYEFDKAHQRLSAYFGRQRGDLPWNEIADHSGNDLYQDFETVLRGLLDAGHNRIYRVDLTNPRFGIPVVKVLVPGLLPIGF